MKLVLTRPQKPNCTHEASQAGEDGGIGNKRSVSQFSGEVCHSVPRNNVENSQNAIGDIGWKVTLPAYRRSIEQ